jgi:broad specificity phosphatase PhoE
LDPPLSAAGQARAQELFEIVKDSGLDAIYATEFQRTQLTGQPTATGLGLTTQVINASDTQILVNNILANHRGEEVLVVGHSNTVPDIVQALGGFAIGPISENDFDNMFIVINRGRCSARIAHLHYGEID